MAETITPRLQKLADVYSPEAIAKADDEYDFQEKLTDELDAHTGDFTQLHVLKIMLWKLNRYPDELGDLLAQLNDLKKTYSEPKARIILEQMLHIKGFDLPMASTVLRFLLPERFQIIDQRVYRLITPEADRLKLPFNVQRKIDLYFAFLERLKSICDQHNIVFTKADRILYQLDKTANKEIKIHGY